MSFKKSVTFTANVADFEDGIVSARVQAENKILDDFVSWILAGNNGIQRLEKISIGDNEWSGQPMHAVADEGQSSAVTDYCSTYGLLSDIHVLGKNSDNFCLGICVDNHTLSLAPICSFAYQRYLNKQVNRPLSIVMSQLRAHNKAHNRVTVGGSLPFFSFGQKEETLSLTINCWRGDDALVFSVHGESDKVFFSSDLVDASWGFSRKNGMLLNFSFNENIQASVETQTLGNSTSTGREHNVSIPVLYDNWQYPESATNRCGSVIPQKAVHPEQINRKSGASRLHSGIPLCGNDLQRKGERLSLSAVRLAQFPYRG